MSGEEDRNFQEISEPISPELILVSPPEFAQRARKLLPKRDPYGPARRVRDRASKTGVALAIRAAAIIAPHAVDLLDYERLPPRRARRRLVFTTVLALALVTAAGALVVRERRGAPSGPPLAESSRISVAAPTALEPPAVQLSPTRAKQHSVRPRRNAPHRRKAARVQRRRRAAAVAAKKPSRARAKAASRATGFTKSARAQAKTSSFVPARVFTWPLRAEASAYVVRFFRNGRRVLQLRVKRPRVALPKSFRFTAGRYRWQVLPVVGTNRHLDPPFVDSTFLLRRR